jgi:hypothetical protein
MSEILMGWAIVPVNQEGAALEVDEVTLLGGRPAMGVFFQEDAARDHLEGYQKMFPDAEPKTVVRIRVQRVIPKSYVPGKGLPWSRR